MQESLPTNPNGNQIAQAQQGLASCVGNCAGEYEKKLPKLKSDIVQHMKTVS